MPAARNPAGGLERGPFGERAQVEESEEAYAEAITKAMWKEGISEVYQLEIDGEGGYAEHLVSQVLPCYPAALLPCCPAALRPAPPLTGYAEHTSSRRGR